MLIYYYNELIYLLIYILPPEQLLIGQLLGGCCPDRNCSLGGNCHRLELPGLPALGVVLGSQKDTC